MFLPITFFLASCVTVVSAFYLRYSYVGIVLHKSHLALVFTGAFIILNAASHILLFGSVDNVSVFLIVFGLTVEAVGSFLMTPRRKGLQ